MYRYVTSECVRTGSALWPSALTAQAAVSGLKMRCVECRGLTRPTTAQQREHPRHQQHLQSVSRVSVSRPLVHCDHVTLNVCILKVIIIIEKWEGVVKL